MASVLLKVNSFPPIEPPQARLLILGSMPGVASLNAQQYYAHPRNAFWPIMGGLFGASPELPYSERVAVLQAHGIAVWDVLASCERPGSLDAAITKSSMVPNDFNEFLTRHPSVRHVFFNGGTAEQSFRRHVLPLVHDHTLILQRLPSTSPAHAAMSLAHKLAAWSVIKETLSLLP
ncbi:DNA-deoxyinosine glycosylase [Salinispirillum sp. LH 10-3-1]|uniref:DNA-deoxyinosine glycosylase n=1 Tax=Salinispirillum sp. LH 10-3-1 TaxID=2952525 RepID=A0AB38YGA1_9GAMM